MPGLSRSRIVDAQEDSQNVASHGPELHLHVSQGVVCSEARVSASRTLHQTLIYLSNENLELRNRNRFYSGDFKEQISAIIPELPQDSQCWSNRKDYQAVFDIQDLQLG